MQVRVRDRAGRRIINDPVLLRLGENHFWLSLADSDVLLWARGVAHGSGLEVTISEPDVGPVQVQGPKSKNVMVDLFGEDILELPHYFLRRYELDGIQVLVSRTGYTGELGYEIYLLDASRHGEQLWDAVLEAGRPHDLAVIGPCHIRRIEGGILAYGADMGLDTNPYEVGIGYDWMVDLEQKADFIGKDALARIKRDGPQRKLAGVEISGDSLGAYNDGSDRLLPNQPRRRARRQRDLGLPLTAAREEHRLRDDSDRAGTARRRARGRRGGRSA